MMKPFFHTGRVMNCDNYYTSPFAFIKLKKAGVFARGTFCSNHDMFPLAIQYKPDEATKDGRGSMKVAVNEEHAMVAMGWVDRKSSPLPYHN